MLNKIIFPIIGFVVLIGMMSVFTVSQTEKAIKFRFGGIKRADYEPGLHFKAPWDSVRKFDARIQTMAEKPEQFLTAEQKNVSVDLFVKWRIADVATFYTAVAGDADQANLRLNQMIKDAFRSEFSRRTIKQLVSEDRSAVRKELMEKSKTIAPVLGIEIIDVRVMRIDLPEGVSDSVFKRMAAERKSEASRLRSEGAKEAEKIRAEADKQRVVALANAFRDAETLRGNADAIAASIYNQAYSQNAEFFNFYRSVNAYKKTFSKSNTLVVDPHSDFFQYFNQHSK
jgi:membrane protease subunit HflC